MQNLHEQSNWRDRELSRREYSSDIQRKIVHLARTAGICAPLFIAEFVKDSEKKWKFVKITSISVGALSMALNSHHSHADYEKERRAIQSSARHGMS